MANQLSNAVSPYLLQHALDPVHWHEWNEISLAEAKRRAVPIFVSIGYSTCHWCHVMARESFADPAVAQRLNESFLPIKIDREERPDLDRIYMAYVQAVTGRGGWPLSVWLTPDLNPFFGGTYFPPEDRGQQSGFGQVLDSIADGWREDRAQIIAEGERMRSQLASARESSPVGDALPDFTEPGGDAFERAYTYFFENHDEQWGGFGGAPKFPRPQVIEFLLRCAALQGLESESGREALGMVQRSLAGMSHGGIHDQVGGGFHRYAVDDGWVVPHFEKMLSDQAQIAGNLIEAYQFTGDERFAGIARHLFLYAARDLRHPQGGFFAGEDADSPTGGDASARREGAFYLWDYQDIRSGCGEEFDWMAQLFGLKPEGNIAATLDPQGEMAGLNVLHQIKSIGEISDASDWRPEAVASRLEDVLDRLRLHRETRPRPHRDEKIVTAWNGLMIASLARASRCQAEILRDSRDEYRRMAEAAASFVRRDLWDGETRILYRAWRDGRRSGPGLAEDYAAMIYGLLELYAATFAVEWLRWADELQHEMDKRFWDESGGGYFQSERSDPTIILQLKDDYDGAEPSANSLAAANQFRLAALLHDDARFDRAMKTLQAFRAVWAETPWALPSMLRALEWALSSRKQVLVSGDPTDPELRKMIEVALDRRGGCRATLLVDPAAPDEWLALKVPLIRELPARTQAQVCTTEHCAAPVNSATDLRLILNL